MDHYSLEVLARQRQSELVETHLRDALVRRTLPAPAQRHFTLGVLPILSTCLAALLLRQVALALGF
jgi:hypothetical protein